MARDGAEASVGKATCATWIRRWNDDGPGPQLLVAFGRGATASSPPLLDLLAFASEPLARVVIGEEGADVPRAIAVHPGGRELICATAKGCRLFKMVYKEFNILLISRDNLVLQSVGAQKCLAFSTDGAKFAIGGEDRHLRVFDWPSLSVILDEPKAHKSFFDMDISLDSDFLVSTSTDGSARIWNIDEGAPLVNLTRSSDEKIEYCRFSRDGTKPFLFCTLVKQGNLDGDFCAVDVKSMEVSHWSKKVHLGSPITSIEFCPTERVVISTSHKWGAEITKLDVPADWKVWQIWLVLASLFVSSAVLFYVFFKYARLNL